MAELGRPSGEHRESELPGDRYRRRRHVDDLLGAELWHVHFGLFAVASSATPASAVAATLSASAASVATSITAAAYSSSAAAVTTTGFAAAYSAARLGERKRVPRLDHDLLGVARGR